MLLLSCDIDESNEICSHLRQNGISSSAAVDPHSADFHEMAAEADLLLIDLNIGSAAALRLVQTLGNAMPVVLMSDAKVTEGDKVQGLELGALDYIEKPFGRCEFIARLRVCLRPARPVSRARVYKIYAFRGWTLNTRHRTLKHDSGVAVKLTSSEYDVLIALLERPGVVLSRDEVLNETRLDSSEVFRRSVDVVIVRLRRKLEAHGDQVGLISTVRGEGYMFDSEVAVRTIEL